MSKQIFAPLVLLASVAAAADASYGANWSDTPINALMFAARAPPMAPQCKCGIALEFPTSSGLLATAGLLASPINAWT